MAVSTRSFRQPGNFWWSQENLGADRAAARGDETAAVRGRLTLGLQSALPAIPGAVPGDGNAFRLIPDTLAASILSAGQLAIIGYNTDDAGTPTDSLTFVLLAALDSGASIHFTDRTWSGSAFGGAGGGDGSYTFTAGSNLAAGTIITITTAQLSGGGMNLSDAGETVYAYQGTVNAPTHFLYAVDIADSNTTFNGTLTGTGLVVGTSAVAVAGDNAHFGGRGHNIQGTALLTSIGSAANWSSDNSTSQLSPTGNLFSAPDQMIFTALAGDAGFFRAARDGSDVSVLQHAFYQWVDTPGTFFNHPNEIVFDTVHGLFFVADSDTGNRRILQGTIADLFNPGATPTLTVLYTDQTPGTGNGQINGLAIDFNHNGTQGALYFVNQTNFNRIVYDHDGTSPTNQTATTLANLGAGQFANEIALDIANNRAWVMSTASGTGAITVPAGTPGAQFDPDSGTWYLVVTTATNNQIYQITGLDRTDTGVGQNTVGSLNFSGVFDDPDVGGATDFNDLKGLLQSIDIDTVGNFLYFTTIQLNNGVGGATGGIFRYNLSTGVTEELYTEGDGTDYGFKYIDVDSGSGRYYVTNISFEGAGGDPSGTSVNTSSIMVHALSSGAPTLFANTPDMNSASPWGLTIQNAPTLTGNANASLVATEPAAVGSGNTNSVTLFNTLAASDLDTLDGTDELAGAQVRISGNFQAGATHQDHLRIGGNLSGSSTGITWSYDSTTGVMTFTGAATVAEYAALLNQVTFNTSGDDPTAYGSALSRTISVSVFDGLLYSDEIHNVVTVTGTNDAPVNTAAADSGDEDTTVFVNGLAIADVDADPTSQNMTVTLTVNRGTLSVSAVVPGGLVAGDIANNNTATVTLTGTQAEINATLGNALGVGLSLGAHGNGTVLLTITTNDNGFNGTPGATQDSDQVTITVNAVNDAPTVIGGNTQALTAIFEDQPSAGGQSINALLQSHYSDALDNQSAFPGGSSPGDFTGIAVVSSGSSASGEWQYSTNGGGSWQNIGAASLSVAKLFNDATLIRFNPATNFNGPAPALTVHLIDNSGVAIVDGVTTANLTGATGGTTPYSTDTVTLSQQVDPVNDAPTSTNVHTDSVTWTEGGAAVLLDNLSNATIADIDSANFDTGTLTVLLSGGVVAQDGLFVQNQGVAAGQIGVGAGTVTFGGTQFATFTGGGFGGGNMVFTFDADATPAAVQALIRAMQYDNNAGDNPTAGTRSVTWTLVDGDGFANNGADTLIFGSSVNVTAVNDPPVINNLGGDSATYTEEGPAVFLDSTVAATVTDIDSVNFDTGTLTVGITTNEVAAEDVLAISTAGTVSLSAGMTVGSVVSVGGTAIGTITATGLSGADLVVAFNASATPALVSTLVQALTYSNTNTTTPSTLARTVTVTVSDGDGGSDSETVTINVVDAPENVAPVLDLNGAGTGGINNTANYTENAGPVLLSPADLIVTDGDSVNLTGATVQVTGGFQASLDLLTVNGATSGTIGAINFSYNGSSGILTLTGTDTLANYQAVLRQVGFESTSDDPGTARTISWTVNDGTSSSTTATTAITVTPINDEPNLAATGTNPTFTEDLPAVDLFNGVTVTTPEAGQTLTSMTLTVTNVTDGADEVLIFDGNFVELTNGFSIGTPINGLTVNVTVAANVATVSFSGANLTPAQLQTLVDNLAYINDSQNPTDANRVITITQIVDSGSNASPNDNVINLSIVSTVNVNPVNDAAVITGDASGDVTEAGGINNTTPGVPTDTGDLNATDVDGPADSWVSAASGSATTNGYGSYSLSAAGVWVYTLNDNNAAVQALFGAATLTDTFTAVTTDGASQMVTITIHAQDDASVANDDAFTTDEATDVSGNVLIDNGSGADGDPDNPGGITVTHVNGVAGNVGVFFALASGAMLRLNANGTFTYDPNGAFDPTPTALSGASNTPSHDLFTYTISGGDTATVNITLTGLDTDDYALGTAGIDIIDAGGGSDTIDGISGADTLAGGGGNDFIYVDEDDVVVELAAGGYDNVLARTRYVLGAAAQVEVLSTSSHAGTAQINLTGNLFGQVLIGNAGTNVLDGAGGADRLAGLGGDDFMFVDSMDDIVDEAVGGGYDNVMARVSYRLTAGAYVEVLSTDNHAGTTAIDLAGNELDNIVVGNAGANVLDGGFGGIDRLAGLGGDDVIYVEAGDIVEELAGGGYDNVAARTSYALTFGAHVEVLSTNDHGGIAAINLTGNDLDNIVIGNAGSNILDGSFGHDRLDGLGGEDSYAFTTNLSSFNVDTIVEFDGGDGGDKILIDNAVFTGLATGVLDPAAFHLGTAATDANHRIIYDAATGALYFDQDGNGSIAQIQFAILEGAPVLTSADITVI